jgi:hypothetical protein
MKTIAISLLLLALLACAGSAQACFLGANCAQNTNTDGRPKGCDPGWYGSTLRGLFGTTCTAEQTAQQAEFEAQAKARQEQQAMWEAQAKQDKLDADFHAIELSCRASSVTYFQYTGCVELMAEAYKSNH